MLSEIIEAENKLEALLPERRLVKSPPTELLAAARAWSDLVWAYAEQVDATLLSDEEIAQGKKLARCPVYICGVHRSGTTLVRDLLDNHSELVVLPSEGTFYTNIERQLLLLPKDKQLKFICTEWLRRFVNPINQPPYWLLGRSTVGTSPYVDFARNLIAWQKVFENDGLLMRHIAVVLAYATGTGNLGAKYWVDKTPLNERFLKRIWADTPEAKIIQLVREPAAALASRKKTDSGFNIRNILRDIKMSYSTAKQFENTPRFMLLPYEELCDDPKKIIEQIASFLEIAISDELYSPTVAGMPSQANSTFNSESPAGKILKADEHRQSQISTEKEEELMAAYLGDTARRLNYPVLKVGLFRGLYLRLKYRLL